MSFAFLPAWHDLLPREGGHLIAVSGFGGKSALIEAAAGVYAAEGIPVVVSAEGFDAPLPELEWSDLRGGAVLPTVFRAVDGGRPLSTDQLDALGERVPDRVVLAELGAGGSAPLPSGSPIVWPDRTSLALLVCGLDAVDRSRTAIDPEGVLPDEHFTETDRGLLWSWPGLERWLSETAMKGLPDTVPTAAALLQLDACDDAVGLFATTGRIMDDLGVPVVLMGDTSGPEPRLRTAFRTDEA